MKNKAEKNNIDDLVLKIEQLKTHFYVHEGVVRAVDDVSFSIKRGSTVAVVGESGCGKSVTAYSILRLIQKPGKVVSGRIMFYPKESSSVDIVSLDKKSNTLFDIRGGQISMIFQEPMTAFSPIHTIGNQICEAILLHQDVTKDQAREIAIEMLRKVGIPGPEKRFQQYPFELSGGMRQRAMIAMALVCNPQLLIADEPTTALDVTIQAQIMKLIKDLQKELGSSVLLITHDFGVVAQMADEVAVMYLGRIVEQAPVRQLMKNPAHPYTMGLLKSLPGMSTSSEKLTSIKGSVPSFLELPSGCPFHPRCDYAQKGRCDTPTPPKLEDFTSEHKVACIRAREIKVNE